jgi:general secretion pathway protein E
MSVKKLELITSEFGDVAIEDVDGNKLLLIERRMALKYKNDQSFKAFVVKLTKELPAKGTFVDSLPAVKKALKAVIPANKKVELEKVITSTNDLILDKTSYVVEDVLINIGEDSLRHFAPVRIKGNSNLVNLYISPDVKGSDSLKDSYSAIHTALTMTSWVSNVLPVLADLTVIDFINAQRSTDISTIETSSDSNSARAAVTLLQAAVDNGSTDIHIHFYSDEAGTVEFRVDKILSPFSKFSSRDLDKMIRHIFNNICPSPATIGLQLSLIQSSQGEVSLEKNGQPASFTLRWQSSPILDSGLKIVIRLLENDSSFILDSEFPELGYTDLQTLMIKKSIATKKGLIITSGTTSSGKSTTNSKIIGDIKKAHFGWAVATVEDPIEYRIADVSQLIVDSSVVDSPGASPSEISSLAFNGQLISLLRQDPDVIGVGEIRDETTAKLILKLVDTGHKAITTIHADSAIYTLDRLVNIGVDRDSLCRPGFFALINYQTLLPKPCKICSEKALASSKVSNDRKTAIKSVFGEMADNVLVANPEGCAECRYGFKGMSACSEMIIPDIVLCGFLRVKDYVGAVNYWKTEMPTLNSDCEYQGRTIIDHMLWKMSRGEICILRSEEDFDNIMEINIKNDYHNHVQFKKDLTR